jgi:hypothetical protein
LHLSFSTGQVVLTLIVPHIQYDVYAGTCQPAVFFQHYIFRSAILDPLPVLLYCNLRIQFDAVVGLLTNNRSLPYTYPLPIVYYFDASHVGQKTNMGLKRLADLVNGESSAIF